MCDCNGQGKKISRSASKSTFTNDFSTNREFSGPWKPLFKPSQLLSDDSSEELRAPHDVENTLAAAATHGHAQTLPGDLHPLALAAASGERQPKKQNHMIHLHLIPHIYVPVLHPVAHPLSVRGPGVLPVHGPVPLAASTPYPFHYPDADGHQHGLHDEHDAQSSHEDAVSSGERLVPEAGSHESSEDSSREQVINIGDPSYPYYPLSSEGHVPHQYEVHEDTNRDPFYGNLAAGSSTKTLQVAAPSDAIGGVKTTMAKIKAAKLVDRSQSSKKHLTYASRRLREMRPPPLGQKITWEMQPGHQSSAGSATKILPSKSSLDWIFGGKNTFFDFDAYLGAKKPFAIPTAAAAMHFTNTATAKRLPSPKIVIYPSNIQLMGKRDDRMFKNGLAKVGRF